MAGMWLSFERRNLFGHKTTGPQPLVPTALVLSSNATADTRPSTSSLALLSKQRGFSEGGWLQQRNETEELPDWGLGPTLMLKGERHMGTNFLTKQLSHNFGQGFRGFLAGARPPLRTPQRPPRTDPGARAAASHTRTAGECGADTPGAYVLVRPRLVCEHAR